MAVEREPASGEHLSGAWRRYDAAVLGLRNYWYPVLFSHQLGRKPHPLTLCGERLVLVRDGGMAYALHDRCPHRGVPLSQGRCAFPGMLTCAYHGWTYDLQTGDLVAALTDGPDSPIVGKTSVRVATYPVAERAGLVCVYVGELPPPPVEEDMPEELLEPNLVLEGRIQLRPGNWRYAAENGIDEGHARYLHRGAVWTFFRRLPAWTKSVRLVPSDDGKWMWRLRGQAIFEDNFPRIGRWPPRERRRYRSAKSLYHQLGIRLLATLMNGQQGWTDYEIWVPVDADHHLAVLLAITHARGPRALRFRLWYRLWARWFFHGQFNGQDQWMISHMDSPPERLYRPDASITAWRKFCHEHARGAGAGDAANGAANRAANEAAADIAGTRMARRPPPRKYEELTD